MWQVFDHFWLFCFIFSAPIVVGSSLKEIWFICILIDLPKLKLLQTFPALIK